MLKGNADAALFPHPADRAHFEELVSQAIQRAQAAIHAFCWLPSSAHFAIQLGEMPLGRIVMRIARPYSRAVNRRLGQSGHRFQHPYRVAALDSPEHLPELVRYIHRLPIATGLVVDPAKYPLSSHGAYLGHVLIPWLTTEVVRRRLRRQGVWSRHGYEQFISQVSDSSPPRPRRIGLALMRAKQTAGAPLSSGVPGSARQLLHSAKRPSFHDIVTTVSRLLNVTSAQVLSPSRQRQLSLARAVITWYATEYERMTLSEVARQLQRDPSTLYSCVKRYRALHPDLFGARCAKRLAGELSRAQRKTS
ncbi:MAG TPA: helix-turn-helix domain-containing protein [Steroidobacteraceae bacterium]|nr:helix-turn-helix domain-containing protein [Steroidobacteraceae bacterium]